MVFGIEVLILKSKCLKTEQNKRIEISSGRKIGEIDGGDGGDDDGGCDVCSHETVWS